MGRRLGGGVGGGLDGAAERFLDPLDRFAGALNRAFDGFPGAFDGAFGGLFQGTFLCFLGHFQNLARPPKGAKRRTGICG